MNKSVKGRGITILFVLLLITGIGILVYPTVSDWVNRRNATEAVVTYDKKVSELSSADIQEIIAEAQNYNSQLASKDTDFSLDDSAKNLYDSLLNPNGNGIMGSVVISSLHINLPIYHGTEEEVLQVGAGHLTGSSLPIGGESTHCVLSGHRGLPSASLFSNIDQLKKGDTFEIHVLGEVLVYQVDQIKTVLPSETSDLQIVQGKDLCTLVTCTPYGINTHRLLVRGHRITVTKNDAQKVTAEHIEIWKVFLCAGAILTALSIITAAVVHFIKNRKKRKERDSV